MPASTMLMLHACNTSPALNSSTIQHFECKNMHACNNFVSLSAHQEVNYLCTLNAEAFKDR